MTQFRPYYTLLINNQVIWSAGGISQTESLEEAATYVFQTDIAYSPELETSLPIQVFYTDNEAGTTYQQFEGVISSIDATSYPNQVKITCSGPLAKLAQVPDNTIDLTGKTDQAAIKAVLDELNIPYIPGDIQGMGLVLGSIKPIKWRRQQTGADVVSQINSVTGYALIENGEGRVIRFPYDKAPNASTISRTYHRGNSTILYQTQRTRGDIYAIQNWVEVTGVTYNCFGPGNEKCSCTPYARTKDSNEKLGAGNYVAKTTFSSDLIQFPEIASYVARRMMQWGNREPDNLVIETVNDPTLLCGTVIGVKNEAYGIGLTGGAQGSPYLVTGIDRDKHLMRISCVGGDAGEVGNIVRGVKRECNDFDTDFPSLDPIPPFPEPDFPEMPPLVPEMPPLPPFPDPGIPEFPEIPTPEFPPMDTPTLPPFTAPEMPGMPAIPGIPPAMPLVPGVQENWDSRCQKENFFPGLTVNPSQDWRITGSFQPSAPGDMFSVGVRGADGDYELIIGAVPSALGEVSVSNGAIATNVGTALPEIGNLYSFELFWIAAETRLSVVITQGVDEILADAINPAAIPGKLGVTMFDNPAAIADISTIHYNCLGPGTDTPDELTGLTDGCLDIDFKSGQMTTGEEGLRIDGRILLENNSTFEVGFHGADGDYFLRISTAFVGHAAEIGGPGTTNTNIGSSPFAINDIIDFQLCWDVEEKTLTGVVTEWGG